MSSHAARAGELDRVFAFNIEAQTLDKALLEFGAQAHVQIMFECDASMVALPARKLKGSYSGKKALAQILQGTRLTYSKQGHTIEILSQAAADLNHSARTSKVLGGQRHAHSLNSNDPVPKSLDPPITQQRSKSSQSTQALDEVVVTAQKYRQPALDVPISLVVIGSQELQEEHIENLNDLQYSVPGLRVEGGGAQQRIIIRGIGNDVGNGAYVSEYIDDADMTSSGYSGAAGYGGTDLQTYDLARVEVLRGPQGTLYGDSSLGGTIRLITNEPVLDRFEMNSNVELPFTEYGAPSQDIEAMINTPITSTSALRVAGEFNHDGGWIDEPAGNLKNINDDNLTDVRIQGLWEPISNLNVRLMQIVHQEAYGLSQGENASGNFTPLFNTSDVPSGQKRFDLSNLALTYDFDRMRLLSSSTYLNSEETLHNYDNNEVGVFAQLVPNLWDSEEKFTQELRLASTGSGPWRWLAGGFFDHDLSGLVNGVEYAGFYSIPSTLSSLSDALTFASSSLLQGANSWAVFGNSSYTLARRLTIGAGLRYYRDQETATGDPGCPCRAAFTSTDPRGYIDYKVTPYLSTYISASKGFRTGGFNTYGIRPYGPESLWSYELGTKMQADDNRVSANVDVFLSNYSNYIVFAVLPAVSTVYGEDYNVGSAKIKGVEGDINWRPNERWLVSASGEYIDAKFVSISSAALDVTYKVGDEVPLSSKYQLAVSVEREFELDNRPAYTRVDYSVLSPQIDYEPVEYSDLIRMLGFEAGIRWSDNLRLGVFAQNILNDRGLLDPDADLGIASRPRPRTYGVDFKVAFGGG